MQMNYQKLTQMELFNFLAVKERKYGAHFHFHTFSPNNQGDGSGLKALVTCVCILDGAIDQLG